MSKWLAVVALAMFLTAGCENWNKKKDSDMDAKAASADVCSHCAGDQVATADGKCSKCGMKVQ